MNPQPCTMKQARQHYTRHTRHCLNNDQLRHFKDTGKWLMIDNVPTYQAQIITLKFYLNEYNHPFAHIAPTQP